jgi:hypothetical protein
LLRVPHFHQGLAYRLESGFDLRPPDVSEASHEPVYELHVCLPSTFTQPVPPRRLARQPNELRAVSRYPFAPSGGALRAVGSEVDDAGGHSRHHPPRTAYAAATKRTPINIR